MGMLSDHLLNTAVAIRSGYPCVDAALLECAAEEIDRLSKVQASAPGLTPRMHDLMLFIQQSFDANGYPPSLDEMAGSLGFAARSGMHRLFQGLIERGYVHRIPNTARGLTILRRVADKSEPAHKAALAEAEARKGDGVSSILTPSPTISTGSMTAAGEEGAGDGAHTPPRTPVTSTTSIRNASSADRPLQGDDDLELPAFLDRRGHG